MSSAKGKFVRLFASMVLERADVVSVAAIGGFQRVLLRCSVRPFAAGAKVQLLLPSDDMRTYSPIPAPEGMVLLGWKHAGGPGAQWMSQARAGDELRLLSPQRSLVLDSGSIVLVGDETSVAVAAAFARERQGHVRVVIQTAAGDDVRAAAAVEGLDELDIVGRGDIASTVDAVKAALSTTPDAAVAVTGGSELVVAVRDALRGAGVRKIKTKTYWIPGKTGLD